MRDFEVEAVEAGEERAVLRVTGEVDVYTAPALRERVLDLAAKGHVHLIVDMNGVDFLDSTGLGALVACLKRLRGDGGSLTLALGTERILRVFRITGLTSVFPPHPTVREAIAADSHWRRTAEDEAGGVEQFCRQHGLA
ncbi:anti-sigma factor antagonist [Streptomyces sp. GC420]|nr:anti-sigma factor antagonist [Streptomyces sp. GC420]